MPRKPATPCRHPGCPELSDTRYCPAHTKQAEADYRRWQRDPKIKRRYNSQWRAIRNAYINAHPLFEQCEQARRITPPKEVHHVP